MNTPPLGSILLGTADPQRLSDWYCAAFNCTPEKNGFIAFGGVGILIDGRTDVSPQNHEPGRFVLNFHVDDARSTAAHLDTLGVSWLVPLEDRGNGLFGTLLDPDGNYLQIIELSGDYDG
jgi:predicted enzyme related to lactoylglutathione lyase